MVTQPLSINGPTNWLLGSTPQNCEELVVSGVQQLMVRRFCTGLAFAMALVLTPRAWVGETTAPPVESIPTQTLQLEEDCLWCEPLLEQIDCGEGQDSQPRIWLNPDEPAGATQDRPCTAPATEERPSA